jgi:hypothetical protein
LKYEFFETGIGAIIMTETENINKKIERIEATTLDQFVQVLEISFIFLLSFTLITLFDTVFYNLNLYSPLTDNFLGSRGIGSLNGGQWDQIVRITLIFNLLLFTFSLTFGLWMRKTRDGWTWAQLGYTLKTPGFKSSDIVRRGVALGLLVLFIYFTLLLILSVVKFGFSVSELTRVLDYTSENGNHFTDQQLTAEYYFGFIEMGFIWPMSAGFFFFAYTHNSLKARFPIGVANILSTLFYVFYLAFFFMLIDTTPKFDQLLVAIQDPFFWGNLTIFFIILYISFSAFAETGSIAIPFLLNFVLNVGLTLLKSMNTIIFTEGDPLMFILYFVLGSFLILWFISKKADFSTVGKGIEHLKDWGNYSIKNVFLLSLLFFGLAFIIPGIIDFIINKSTIEKSIKMQIIPFTFAFLFILLIILAIVVLTYEPTKVYDVLIMSMDGLPIASKLALFQSDDILISGFFSAISSFNEAVLEGEAGELRSIKRGEREIILEDGVLTRTIALLDKDHPKIRQSISNLHKDFELRNFEVLKNWNGEQFKNGFDYVEKVSNLEHTFNIPQQTIWMSVLTLAISPLMIILIGLL